MRKSIALLSVVILLALSAVSLAEACNHQFGGWSYDPAPTCTKAGKRNRKCNLCDHHEWTPVAATGHNFTQATCIYPMICKTCKLKNGKPLGHNYSKPTCVSKSTCSRCGGKTGSLAPHQYSAPSCSKNSVCSVCQNTIPPQLPHQISPATCRIGPVCNLCHQSFGSRLPHNFVNGTCTSCGLAVSR